jgi:hypothetical protein
MPQEDDPISTIEGAPKRIADFLLELYKVMRDKKQQEMMQQQQQAHQDAMQKQQQQFMMEQNERLMDVMRQSGLPDSDGTRNLAKSGLTRLERLAEDEVQTQAKLGDVDKQIGGIDMEQRMLLAPDDVGGIDKRLGELDQQMKASDESYLNKMKQLNTLVGKSTGTGEEMDPAALKEIQGEMDKLNQQKTASDKLINDERGALKQKKSTLAGIDTTNLDGEFQKLDQQKLDSDNLFKQQTKDLMNTPGITPDELTSGLEKLKTDQAKINEGFAEKRGILEKVKNPLTQDQKADKLQELHGKKADLLKQKGGLQEKMKGIKSEVGELTKAKELTQGLGQGQGMGQGMGNVKVGGPIGKLADFGSSYMNNGGITGTVMYGGFDLVKKAAANPKSVASSILKEIQETGKSLGQGLKNAVTSGRAFKH